MSFNDTSDQVISGGIDNEIKVLYIFFSNNFELTGNFITLFSVKIITA